MFIGFNKPNLEERWGLGLRRLSMIGHGEVEADELSKEIPGVDALNIPVWKQVPCVSSDKRLLSEPPLRRKRVDSFYRWYTPHFPLRGYLSCFHGSPLELFKSWHFRVSVLG